MRELTGDYGPWPETPRRRIPIIPTGRRPPVSRAAGCDTFRRGLFSRQMDLEGRARVTIDRRDGSSVTLDNLSANGQSQPHAFAAVGEQRLEDLHLVLGGDPRPVVGNHDLVVLIRVDCLNAEVARIAERLDRIGKKIPEDLLLLGPVAVDKVWSAACPGSSPSVR